MITVYLALGSNVGDARGHIKQAIALLTTMLAAPETAPLYLSKAVGYTDQPDFVNTVIRGQTDLKPEALLERLKQIEQQIGRTPSFRHGPREIDIDIIFYGDLVMETPQLVIPHPRFKQRDFVLQPLCDLDPSLTDPLSGQTVKALLAKITAGQKSLIKQVDAGR